MIYLDASMSGNTKLVKLQVVADHIIKVTATPSDKLSGNSSLITVYQPSKKVNWTVSESPDQISISTKLLTATVRTDNGAITFTGKDGKTLLAERQRNGRYFEPTVIEGTQTWHIRQVYETTADDAYYGLGQHQDDVFNYKGQQVFLFQNNSEVAVPFLVSTKNYGLLWDNYSVSWVGDVRTFQPISSLQLCAATGEKGWLTASYCNDKNDPSRVTFQKAESEINYEFLGDSKLLPADFNTTNGLLRWEGTIASPYSGIHKFRFTYGGYCKIWIDGNLIADKWRQAWNPGSALVNIALDSGRKYPVKIEWIPDGGESYISAKWLSPVPETDQNSYAFSADAGQQLTYYFVYGNSFDEIIAGYRTLTGKAPIVPKWALGLWQSRERYKTQEEILETVQEFRKRRIPLDNIVLDWSYWKEDAWGSQEFDAARFSNPDSMINLLHNRYNTHFMISVWPKFYEGNSTYKLFNDSGWLYTRNIADRQRDWIGKGYVSTFYDAFNSNAQKAFWKLLNERLYSKGIDAWWMDASEPDILSNVTPEKRKQQMAPLATGIAAEYLNAYPLENAKGIYEGQRSVNPGQRVFILTRSAFAGSQRYGAATWSGDIASRWEDMKAQISAGINFSMSGIPYWTMDIGGFAVERRYEHPDENDLEEWRAQMTRWYQFGAFCPLFRVHGQFPFREIYNTAPEEHPAYKSMLYYDHLRYRLLPYIYSLAGAAYHHNYTIMRGLVMDFAQDNNVRNIGDQFMFGPSLLVNPVYRYRDTSRQLYLPAGQGWYDLYTGTYTEGNRSINAYAPYEHIPVFVKEGSIIPNGPALQYTSEKVADPVTLMVYTGKDAQFILYEDEGTNYNYEKGSYSTITIEYKETTRTLTIGKCEGSFTGMPAKRMFRIVFITREKPKSYDPDQQADATIRYSGKAVTVKMK